MWPASCKKEPSDITNSVDPDHPNTMMKTATCICNPIAYTARNICAFNVTSVKKTLIRHCDVDAAAGLGLHFFTCPKVRFRMTLAKIISTKSHDDIGL